MSNNPAQNYLQIISGLGEIGERLGYFQAYQLSLHCETFWLEHAHEGEKSYMKLLREGLPMPCFKTLLNDDLRYGNALIGCASWLYDDERNFPQVISYMESMLNGSVMQRNCQQEFIYRPVLLSNPQVEFTFDEVEIIHKRTLGRQDFFRRDVDVISLKKSPYMSAAEIQQIIHNTLGEQTCRNSLNRLNLTERVQGLVKLMKENIMNHSVKQPTPEIPKRQQAQLMAQELLHRLRSGSAAQQSR